MPASTFSGSVTSIATKMARPPALSIRRTVSLPAAWSSSATATPAPSAANRIAASRPIPPPAPVISAIFPFKRAMTTSLPFRGQYGIIRKSRTL